MAYTISDNCIACGACKEQCAYSAVREGVEHPEIIQEECMECGTCMDGCPAMAIKER